MSFFPVTGRPREEILAALVDHRASDLKSDGHAFAFIYDGGEAIHQIAREAFAACMTINGLDPTAYPSARKIENAVIGACLELAQAPAGAAGTATAGGTESVILAVKAARDFSRRTRPQITAPKMLLPVTAHACFHKAAHYLGVEAIPVEVDPVTFRASVADARKKMSADVILVVGSAPSYAHGVIDPIEELAALAVEHGALMHVDACVGGWVLPFMRENGLDLPAFDFTVPGVTSLSMDLHKYGFAPKGVSVLLQRRRELRDAQYFACASWTGYTVVNSTTLGSKSLSALGAAFAIIHTLGREGYRARTRAMWDATQQLVAVVDGTEGLRMLGRPDMNMFAFTTVEGDIFELADRLTARGWHVQPTYGFGPSPAHIHLSLEPGNAAKAGAFGKDLREAMRELPLRLPAPPELVEILEQLGTAGVELDPSILMEQLGVTDGRLPESSAMIHRLLDAASPGARERVLTMFFGELFS